MSIQVNNLSKTYGKQKAVNNISFSVDKGEIVGFLGPNGAGKSTTMKMITSFIPPTSGSATVCGFDVEKDEQAVKKCIGYLPESNPLYKDMYVKEYLYFVARVQSLDNKKSRVADIVERTGLSLEQRKKIGQLSKGYRQRVGLAQAMIHNPDVLVLDEPTSGLDPNQLAEIRELIKEIGKEKTVLLSTHIMQEVHALCDRIIIINRGEIVANDQTSNLQQSGQQNIYTVEFSKKIDLTVFKNFVEEELIEEIKKNTFKISSSEEVDKRADIFKFAVENDMILLTLKKEESSLEDVFKKVTSRTSVTED